MQLILTLLQSSLLLALSAVVGYQGLIVLLAAFRRQTARPRHAPQKTRFAVLVPAHDEELLIERTVKSLLAADYPARLREVVVIADNCTDATAEVARRSGATVLERADTARRGKGHALHWALNQLGAYDAYAVIDADSVVSANFFSALDTMLLQGAAAVQVLHGTAGVEQSWLGELIRLSDSLQFHVYNRSRQVLGLSVRLYGNGMCLSRALVERFGWNAFSITENWEYYLHLLSHGITVRYSDEAAVWSQQVARLGDAKTQRMRWMVGKRRLVASTVPRLALLGLREGRLGILDGLADFLLPSYSMQGIMLASAALLSPVTRINLAWLAVLATAFILYCATALRYVSVVGLLRALPKVPVYLLWKIWIKLASMFRCRAMGWIRTRRRGEPRA
ncbi:MAG: glycosyltransferase family 2 protein [Pseudomonadota bacterium]